ncbi:LLM class flavin-dependent oxidoreductase [Candidatus Thorarchaeota archaeon]|nr:MAG: LLM class flavin-dependent oxidoreductase [Candidatus Thorarchaeota archaeon]
MYRLSLGITTKMSVETTDWIARHAKTLGADGIWIGEDIGAGQDVFVLAASVLLRTSEVRVGTGIVPISTHNLTTIARSSLALHEVGNGRFALGLGIGGTQDLQSAGMRIRKPVTEMRKATELLHSLWRGETVSVMTELTEVESYSLRLSEDITVPVFFGVRGPQMLDLAGRVSDGVILSGPFEYIERAIDIVRNAAVDTSRDPAEIEIVVWIPTIPTFRGIKKKVARRIVALVVADTPESVVEMLSVNPEKLAKIRRKVASAGPKAGAEFVDDHVLDAFSISGSKQHMANQFETLASLGVNEIVLGPPYAGEWKSSLAEVIREAKGGEA